MSKSYVAIEIGDDTYKLCLDFNAMCAFEEARGKSMGQLFQAFQEAGTLAAFSAMDLRCLIWCALRRHHGELTEDDVGGILHQGNFQEILSQVSEAMAEFLPEGDEEQDPPQSLMSALPTGSD